MMRLSIRLGKERKDNYFSDRTEKRMRRGGLLKRKAGHSSVKWEHFKMQTPGCTDFKFVFSSEVNRRMDKSKINADNI